MSNIAVYTFLTSNSKNYAELLGKSIYEFSSTVKNDYDEYIGVNRIKLYCVESIDCDGVPHGWESVGKITKNKGHNCNNHAAALHLAQDHARNSSGIDYIVFVDCDICILYQDWDEVVCSELNSVDIWGTAFGDDSAQYNKFPNVFFFCFRKNILNNDQFRFNFNPRLKGESPERIELNDIDRKWLRSPNKKKMKCDTGWELPFTVYVFNLVADYMPRILGRDRGSQLPFENVGQKFVCSTKPLHMAEWHYKGKMFLTHKQASRNHPLDKSWGKIWKERINLYTQKKYGIIL